MTERQIRMSSVKWESANYYLLSYFIISVIKKEHISCILLSVLSRSIVELQSALNLEEKGKTEIKKNQTLFSFIKDSSLCLLNPITLTSVKSYSSSSELHWINCLRWRYFKPLSYLPRLMSSHEEIMAPSVLFIGNKKEKINIKRSKEENNFEWSTERTKRSLDIVWSYTGLQI